MSGNLAMPGGPGLNAGHGHVYPRPDGTRARCGGPALCGSCKKDQRRRDQELFDSAPGLIRVGDELLGEELHRLRYGSVVVLVLDAFGRQASAASALLRFEDGWRSADRDDTDPPARDNTFRVLFVGQKPARPCPECSDAPIGSPLDLCAPHKAEFVAWKAEKRARAAGGRYASLTTTDGPPTPDWRGRTGG